MAEFVGAVDQGTTNTRFMIFDHGGNEVARHQLEHEQIMPRPGWVEHDPAEIWARTRTVIETGLRRARLEAADLAAVGIANQRETTLVWNRTTGRPYYNAIVWQDTRTDRIAATLERDGRGDIIRKLTGLPPAACFSGGKIQWILENIDGVRDAAETGDALFGTVDSWLLWRLTGGADGGVSRLMLGIPLAVVGDEEIQQAVVVVVEPARRDRPHLPALQHGAADARFRRYVAERAIAVVVEELIPVDVGEINVGPAVVIVVAHRHAHAVA